MRLKNYDIYCYQGETFSLDFSIINEDGGPYVVSNKMLNAKLLLTISSTRYSQKDDVVERYWLDLTNLPKFYNTTAVKLETFDKLPDGWTADEAIYYVEDEFGNKTYKYYDNEGNWKDYDFRITFGFTSEQTNNWIEQRYLYSIKLVDGEKDLQKTLKFEECTIVLEPHNIFVQSDRGDD